MKFLSDVTYKVLNFNYKKQNKLVRELFVDRATAAESNAQSLSVLFKVIDEVYFHKFFQNYFAKSNDELVFNDTLQSDHESYNYAAVCIIERAHQGCVRTKHTISINFAEFEDLFKEGHPFLFSTGIRCYDTFECLLHIMEHEMVHMFLNIANIQSGLTDTNVHGRIFKRLALDMFGQTKHLHTLHEHPANIIEVHRLKMYHALKEGTEIDLPDFDVEVGHKHENLKGQRGTVLRVGPQSVKVQVRDMTVVIPLGFMQSPRSASL